MPRFSRPRKSEPVTNGHREDVAADGALPSSHDSPAEMFVDPAFPTEAETLSDASEEMENEVNASAECASPEELLQADLDAALRDLARERASFANYRQRIDKEKDEIRRYSGIELARDLIRVLDYFQMSMHFDAPDLPPAAQNVMQGVQYTVGELQRVCESHGITPIPATIGAMVEPGTMEAIATEVRDDLPPGTILSVQTPGYRFKDRILRPARVTVAVAPESVAEAE